MSGSTAGGCSVLAADVHRVGQDAAALLVVRRRERKHDVVGGERVAVGEDDVRPQLERVAQAVGGRVQLSASHGSTSCVARLTRTSLACVRGVTR